MNTAPSVSADFHTKPLETLIQELPTDLRVEVRNFVEFLLLKRARTVKQSSLYQDQASFSLRGEASPSVVAESPIVHTEEHGADAWHFLTDHAGSLTAPEDWAAEHDHYLYGIAKQRERADVP